MLIVVKRFEFKDTHTVGKMYVDGIYECYTLEDVVRNGTKVLGKTAIPIGEYKLIVDASTRFKQDMPHILDVLTSQVFVSIQAILQQIQMDVYYLAQHGQVKTL